MVSISTTTRRIAKQQKRKAERENKEYFHVLSLRKRAKKKSLLAYYEVSEVGKQERYSTCILKLENDIKGKNILFSPAIYECQACIPNFYAEMK